MCLWEIGQDEMPKKKEKGEKNGIFANNEHAQKWGLIKSETTKHELNTQSEMHLNFKALLKLED